MTNPIHRANLYKERDAECLRLAEIATDDEMPLHYRLIAGTISFSSRTN
jgi:hypothetical protein